jgi:hypothetical protein
LLIKRSSHGNSANPVQILNNAPEASRTLCWAFQDVVGHRWIAGRDSVQQCIKWKLGVRVAVLARFDQPFGFAQSWGVNQDDNLLS